MTLSSVSIWLAYQLAAAGQGGSRELLLIVLSEGRVEVLCQLWLIGGERFDVYRVLVSSILALCLSRMHTIEDVLKLCRVLACLSPNYPPGIGAHLAGRRGLNKGVYRLCFG